MIKYIRSLLVSNKKCRKHWECWIWWYLEEGQNEKCNVCRGLINGDEH